MYEKHTQVNAIDFIDHVVERSPFRIHTVRTACHQLLVVERHAIPHPGRQAIPHAVARVSATADTLPALRVLSVDADGRQPCAYARAHMRA